MALLAVGRNYDVERGRGGRHLRALQTEIVKQQFDSAVSGTAASSRAVLSSAVLPKDVRPFHGRFSVCVPAVISRWIQAARTGSLCETL